MGLTGAALEKTFLQFTTGEFISNGQQFSCDNVSSLVDDYINNATSFSVRKWDTILRLCGSTAAQSQPPAVSAESMSTRRRELYVPSSPVQEDDE
ncbi:hypothetical protein B0H14DRAFT_3524637 [Mycena olivaceomarginata]|nr:hypothetical protein B0H14DRAFT_3524637 [Mycena olivaceomarginata]